MSETVEQREKRYAARAEGLAITYREEKKKEKFLKSMIKVKISINATMLKKYMIDENEKDAECTSSSSKKKYRKWIRGHESKYFVENKKVLETELANECLDNIIYQLDIGECSPYEEFSISDFTMELKIN
tara:strand:+ start:1190 stop:1579 length:390 start_codon:yes stop_codon:yes gene_type:complete